MYRDFKLIFKDFILSAQLSITALFILIAFGYSIINPLFEAPDEIWHYEYVRWLKEGHGLAEPADIGHAPWAQEGTQPPLYYLLGAALISGISTENAESAIHYNPHSDIGNAEAFGNKNQMIHGEQERWPWHGMALSVHLLRCFSILLGATTVLCTGAIARHLSQNPVIVATAMSLVAFNPQFLFISASVSNDNLVTALSTVALWLLLRILSQDAPPTRNILILLGALSGALALSKLSGLLIIPITFLCLIWLAWQRRSSYELLRSSSIVGLTALAVAGWWYVRNWVLFGDPLALNAMFAVLPARTESAGVAELISLWPGIWRSFWAVFGWFNIVVDEWAYIVYTFIAGMAALSLVFKLLRYTFSREPFLRQLFLSRATVSWFLLIGWSAGITLLLVRWAQINYPQGRLLFPAIGAMMPLCAYGLLHWLPNRLQKYVSIVLCIMLATIAIAIPFRWIQPTYATNVFYTEQRGIDEFKNVNFGNLIQLQSQEISPSPLQQSLHPGDSIDVTLYWKLLEPTSTKYSVFLHVVDELGIFIAQRDSYPGLGNLPTSQWPLQTLIADPHQITIPTTAYAPAKLDIYLGLYDFHTGQRLPTNEGDRVYLQSFKLQSADDQGIPNPQYINFDNKIALRGYELDRRLLHPGDTLALTIWWEALSNMEKNYKVFTHLLLPPDAVWAQDDQEPHEGQLPTSTWQTGEIVQDRYLLQIPENAPSDIYRIEVGLYGSEDGQRLPVNFSTQGIPLGHVKVHR